MQLRRLTAAMRLIEAYASHMAHPAPTGYGVDDLDWLRDELGIAHLELDPWGSLIVTPATDEHELVLAVLHAQVVRQLDPPGGNVQSNGFAWKIPGGAATRTSPIWPSSSPVGSARTTSTWLPRHS